MNLAIWDPMIGTLHQSRHMTSLNGKVLADNFDGKMKTQGRSNLKLSVLYILTVFSLHQSQAANLIKRICMIQLNKTIFT